MTEQRIHYSFIYKGAQVATKWCTEEEAYYFSAQWEVENGLSFGSVLFNKIEN